MVKIYLPKPVRPLPEIFREAGYYVCNGNSGAVVNKGKKIKGNKGIGKTDYNFVFSKDLYDGADWSGRKKGQPFFAQVMLKGGKYRSVKLKNSVSPSAVNLPPYYPDHPVMREDWARYLNSVIYIDKMVGLIMKQLKDEGVADNTVVIFITDHGISHARGKQYLYDEGTRIPFIVRAPGRVKSGTKRDDLIVHIDMAATSLYFAGIKIPDYMESRPLLGKDASPREYVVFARDRCDETVEHLRSVRKGKYKYIRNFYPKRPHLQPNRYKDQKDIIKTLRELNAAGKLNRDQSLIFKLLRPEEELYDLKKDPYELHDLAGQKAYEKTLKELKGILKKWIKETDDKGQYPESDELYDSDMKVYIGLAE